MGRSVSWGEAIRLAHELARDTTSHVCAALNGWDYPASREALVLMDLFDAYRVVHFKQPKPYPRPWPQAKTQRLGDAGGRSRAEVVAFLNSLGHHLPTD